MTYKKLLENDFDLMELAKSPVGIVGSKIASICRSGTMIALAGLIYSPEKRLPDKLLIRLAHFKQGINRIQEK